MSKEHAIRIDFIISRAGHGIVSSITDDVSVLKWNDLVKYLSLMYTECKDKLPPEDFDHTNFIDQEAY